MKCFTVRSEIGSVCSLPKGLASGVHLKIFSCFIDQFILLGVMGLHELQCETSGLRGFFGFMIGIAGTGIIIGSEGEIAFHQVIQNLGTAVNIFSSSYLPLYV
ncbi:MAG TPA: hypothetical protein V6D19_05665 [Stenomitos sp.]